ncbi:SIMPL domain-containing protein [Candidatus Falkowbacteria bacterium]|nr:SIMPL domain-containing protein [Candidatus Falkowbacteria bacterium]
MNTFWPKFKENPLFFILLTIFSAVLIIVMIFWARNLYKQNYYIGKNPQIDRTITITGEGKVTAIPDIATLSLGMENTSMDIQEAQKKNSGTMNSLLNQLTALNVAKEDIQTTSYNIYPQYDWIEGRQILRGYTISQNVVVKIRDTEKVDEVLKIVGDLKLNQVGGLNFDVDEPETYRQQARELALQNAKEKADALANIMGVKLGKVISFNESGAPTYYDTYYKTEAIGLGGGGTAPSVSAGSQEIIVNASVVYELD